MRGGRAGEEPQENLITFIEKRSLSLHSRISEEPIHVFFLPSHRSILFVTHSHKLLLLFEMLFSTNGFMMRLILLTVDRHLHVISRGDNRTVSCSRLVFFFGRVNSESVLHSPQKVNRSHGKRARDFIPELNDRHLVISLDRNLLCHQEKRNDPKALKGTVTSRMEDVERPA